MDNYLLASKVHKAFLLYQRVCRLEEHILRERPRGHFGIAVDNDELAIKYQQRVAWRKEVLSAYLSGRKPNPYFKRWYVKES